MSSNTIANSDPPCGNELFSTIQLGVPYPISIDNNFDDGLTLSLQYSFRPINVQQYDCGELIVKESQTQGKMQQSASVRLTSKSEYGSTAGNDVQETFTGSSRNVEDESELLLRLCDQKMLMSRVDKIMVLRHEMKIQGKANSMGRKAKQRNPNEASVSADSHHTEEFQMSAGASQSSKCEDVDSSKRKRVRRKK